MGLTTLGVIGGTGWLGGALLRPALAKGFVAAADLILSSRSGNTAGFEAWPDIRFTTDNRSLAAQSDIVILSVRPKDLDALDLDLSGKLVISVMARVPAEALLARFNSERIIRAMPNACAEQGLSFTPWLSTPGATDNDAAFADSFFACSGKTTRLSTESELDYFTALTGSGPALIAAFADVMIRDAIENGVAPDVAVAGASETPADTVKIFTDYGGTTAAGLTAMLSAGIAAPISKGLAAAKEKAAKG